jgi:hypothetical protein
MISTPQDPVTRLQRRTRLERLADVFVAIAGTTVLGVIGAFFVTM